jgi:hypothetical protein
MYIHIFWSICEFDRAGASRAGQIRQFLGQKGVEVPWVLPWRSRVYLWGLIVGIIWDLIWVNGT